MPNKSLSKQEREQQYRHFEELYAEAHRAGMIAVFEDHALAAVYRPELLHENPFSNGFLSRESVGMAWIVVNGSSRFGRWAKKYKGWSLEGSTGMKLAVHYFAHSEGRKFCYAQAFARVLKSAGIQAVCERRSD